MTHILVPINYRINRDVTYDPPPHYPAQIRCESQDITAWGWKHMERGGGGKNPDSFGLLRNFPIVHTLPPLKV